MAKNYYLILGISRFADPPEVRDAYRRLVKRYHPDRNQGDPLLFMDIHEAYEVLSNPERRSEYDRALERARVFRPRGDVVIEPVRPTYSGHGIRPEPMTPEPIRAMRPDSAPPVSLRPTAERQALGDLQTVGWLMDEWFESDWEHFFAGALRGGPEVYSGEIILSQDDAKNGGQVSLRIPARRRCSSCRGTGGQGWYPCGRCAGSGEVEREIPLNLHFPPGIPDNYKWVMPLDRYGVPDHRLEILFRVTDQY